MKISSGRTATVVLALTVLVGACSDGASDEAVEEALTRCEPVPQATVDLIATGLTIDGGVGNVFPLTSSGNGSTLVSPVAGTTYTLTASDGSEVQSAQVNVAVGSGGPFAINEFLASNFKLFCPVTIICFFFSGFFFYVNFF